MNIEELREYCLSKPHVSEKLPFDEFTLVFFVGDKMFALIPTEDPELKVNLKCDPERSELLRVEQEGIIPGFHMNKKHWNTLYVEQLSKELVIDLVDHSYSLVINGLTKKKKIELGLI